MYLNNKKTVCTFLLREGFFLLFFSTIAKVKFSKRVYDMMLHVIVHESSYRYIKHHCNKDLPYSFIIDSQLHFKKFILALDLHKLFKKWSNSLWSKRP